MEKNKRKKWNGYLAAGLFMTGLAVFLGILGYFWTPYSTTAMSAAEKFTAPSMHHIFGTDNFGRDIFSRVMQGLGTIGRPFFNCGRCFVRSIYRIFRRHFR